MNLHFYVSRLPDSACKLSKEVEPAPHRFNLQTIAAEEIDELYPYASKPDPQWCEIREFYCPGCFAQLEVETAPFGYPLVFDFFPDLDAFYGDWLERPLAHQTEFQDLTHEKTRGWAEEQDGLSEGK